MTDVDTPAAKRSRLPWIVAASAAAVVLILAGVLIGVLTRSDPKTAAEDGAADPGVAQCMPLSRALEGSYSSADVDAADDGFSKSTFADIRDAGGRVVDDLRAGNTDSSGPFDQDRIDLWTACARHGVVVAPGYGGVYH